MKVVEQRGSYRIVDDAPYSLAMDGVGLFSIEKYHGTKESGWWKQVYPVYFKCTNDLEEVTRKFNELTK